MNLVLLIGTFESAFLMLLLLGKRRKSKPDLYLGIILFLYFLTIGASFMEVYNRKNSYPYPMFINTNWLFLLLHGPALWFYIKSLSVPGFKIKAIHFLHLTPFIIFLIIQYRTFLILPVNERIAMVIHDDFTGGWVYKSSVITITLSTIGYNLWALWLIKLHEFNIRNVFSNIEGIDLNWLKVLTIAWLICYGFNVSLFSLDLVFNFAPYITLILIAYVLASVYVLFIGYYGLLQKNVFLQNDYYALPIPGQPSQKQEQQTEPDSFIQELLSFMDQKKPYLEPDLNILKLAKFLDVTPEYLSEKLNSQLHKNFFDFINHYRIEEFKVLSMSKEKKHLSILGLAYESGFNSKATFYRTFKRFENTYPSDYLRKSQ